MTQPSIPRLSREIVDQICRSLGKTSSQIYVLWNATHSTVAFDPATKQPVHSTNKKVAERLARDSGNIAMPLNEALQKLIKHQQNQ